jgi:hypothetical protein
MSEVRRIRYGGGIMKPNSLMLAGAICGLFIWWGFTGLQETYRHKGPGIVTYESGSTVFETGSEFDVTVSEAKYKRHHYVVYGFLLALGIYGWIGILRAEAKMAKKKAASLEVASSTFQRPRGAGICSTLYARTLCLKASSCARRGTALYYFIKNNYARCKGFDSRDVLP